MTAVPEWKDATGFKGAGWLKWFKRFRSVVDIFPSSLPLSGYLRFKASSTMSFPQYIRMGLIRQTAVSTVSKPGEQRQNAVTSLTAFSLGIRLDFVVTANLTWGYL